MRILSSVWPSTILFFSTLQERRQSEGVAAILHAENAQQEAIQAEHNASVNEDHGLLELGAADSWGSVGKADRAESKYGIYAMGVSSRSQGLS